MHPAVPHRLVTPSAVKTLLGLAGRHGKSSPVTTASPVTVSAVTDIPRGTCSEDVTAADLADTGDSASEGVSTERVAA
jgi:hypothetical protein